MPGEGSVVQEQQDRTMNPVNGDEQQPADGGADQAAQADQGSSTSMGDSTPSSAGSTLRSTLDATSIVAGLAAGVTVQDEQGGLVFANAIAASMSGYPSPEALLAATPTDLVSRIELFDEHGGSFDWGRLPGRRILAGDEPEPTLVGFRERPTGVEHWSMIEARVIVEPDGRRLVVNTFHDVSPRIASERTARESERRYREMADERRMAEERAQMLADAALRLDEARDLDEAASVAAEAPVPALADWCVIDLLEPDGRLRRAAMAARDPELAARIEPLRDHPGIRGTERASERAVAGREPICRGGRPSRRSGRLRDPSDRR